MLETFGSGILWVLQRLLSILPDSPVTRMFGGWASGLDALTRGLRVLNWMVDINGCLIMMGIWVLAIQAYLTFRWLLRLVEGAHNPIGSAWNLFKGLFGGGTGEID